MSGCCLLPACMQVQQSWGLSHPVITQLPFSSSFNTGAGWARFAAGRPQTHSSIAGVPATAESSRTAVIGGAGSSRAAVGVTGAGSWYDLCETDTLPSVRDPITQQVRWSTAVDARACCSYSCEECFATCCYGVAH